MGFWPQALVHSWLCCKHTAHQALHHSKNVSLQPTSVWLQRMDIGLLFQSHLINKSHSALSRNRSLCRHFIMTLRIWCCAFVVELFSASSQTGYECNHRISAEAWQRILSGVNSNIYSVITIVKEQINLTGYLILILWVCYIIFFLLALN